MMWAAYIPGIPTPIATHKSKNLCYWQALNALAGSVSCPIHGELARKIIDSEISGDDAKLLEIKELVVS